MKLKELCERTGLSRKTIRLYEEKELFTPKKEVRNGREYRDYSEEDVRTLLVVASLRKAWFTMEEIRRMQQDPAAIGEILPQYQQWLRLQKRQLEGLLSAAEKLDLEEIGDVETLSAKFEKETNKLPLPATDRNPHFKYLDDLEKEERAMKTCLSDERKLANTDGWIRRRMALNLSKADYIDYNFTLRQFRETQELVQRQQEAEQQRQTVKQPWWLRRVKGLLTLTATVLAVMCMVKMLGGMFPLKLWVPFLLTAGVRLAMACVDYCRERQAWIDRMNANR